MLQALRENVDPPDHQALQVGMVSVATLVRMVRQVGMERTVALDSR